MKDFSTNDMLNDNGETYLGGKFLNLRCLRKKMMKKEIKIGFHSAVSKNIIDIILRFIDQDQFIPVITPDYDYYFAMETIYKSQLFMRELGEAREDAIKILFCGEAVYPDMNLFDYALFISNYYKVEDRIIYLPLLELNRGYVFANIDELDNSKSGRKAEEILSEKNKFCNFIYSNAKAHEMRDRLFHEICRYKKVDSLGKHLKNADICCGTEGLNWEQESIEMKRSYKFSIAAENARFAGYTSEKIMTSMMANTIPIYFGNPYIGEEYNSKAFINITDYNDVDAVLERIITIDQDDELFCEIMKEPWRTEEQIHNCNNAIKKFYKSFNHIFSIEKRDARRRPEGTWATYLYPQFVYASNNYVSKDVPKNINKIVSYIKNVIYKRTI